MSEPASDPHAAGVSEPDTGAGASLRAEGVGRDGVAPSEESWLSYEGATVPRFLALIWVAFLIFAVVYLLRYVPASWMEWFQ